jgi:hypothetical protein
MDLIHNYEALVPLDPIYYKACTSGVAYALGDFISQVFQGRDLKTLDLARTARSGTAGFIGHGPLCHYWMVFMVRATEAGLRSQRARPRRSHASCPSMRSAAARPLLAGDVPRLWRRVVGDGLQGDR